MLDKTRHPRMLHVLQELLPSFRYRLQPLTHPLDIPHTHHFNNYISFSHTHTLSTYPTPCRTFFNNDLPAPVVQDGIW